jgi:hypothetical protein
MSETPSDEINSKFSLGEDNGDLYIFICHLQIWLSRFSGIPILGIGPTIFKILFSIIVFILSFIISPCIAPIGCCNNEYCFPLQILGHSIAHFLYALVNFTSLGFVCFYFELFLPYKTSQKK